MEENSDKPVVKTAIKARQGFLDRPILAVLAVSTVLAAGVLFLLWQLWT